MGVWVCPRGKHPVAGRGGYVAVPRFPAQAHPPVPNVALREPQPPQHHLDPLWCPGKSCVRLRLLTTRAVCGSPVQHQMPVFVGQESRHGRVGGALPPCVPTFPSAPLWSVFASWGLPPSPHRCRYLRPGHPPPLGHPDMSLHPTPVTLPQCPP